MGLHGPDSGRFFRICHSAHRTSPSEVTAAPKPLATQRVKQLFDDFTCTDVECEGIKSELAWVDENLAVGVSKAADAVPDHIRSTDRTRIEASDTGRKLLCGTATFSM